MKKMILMAAIMLSSVSAFAQNEVGQFTLQPKVGINFANLTGDGTKGKPNAYNPLLKWEVSLVVLRLSTALLRTSA